MESKDGAYGKTRGHAVAFRSRLNRATKTCAERAKLLRYRSGRVGGVGGGGSSHPAAVCGGGALRRRRVEVNGGGGATTTASGRPARLSLAYPPPPQHARLRHRARAKTVREAIARARGPVRGRAHEIRPPRSADHQDPPSRPPLARPSGCLFFFRPRPAGIF